MTVGVALRGIILLVAAGNVSGAQARNASPDPAQVVKRYLAAVAKEQWKTAAQDLDLQVLDNQRQQLLRNVADTAHRVHLTAEDLMKFDPELPRAVAEYQVRRSERDAASFNMFELEFAGVPDAKTLANLSREELGARWVRATGIRYRIEKEFSHNKTNCPPPVVSAWVSEPPPAVIGAVIEGKRAYVIVDMFADAHAMRKSDDFWQRPVNVYQLRHVNGRWQILPTHVEGGMSIACSIEPDSAKSKSK